VLDAIDSPSLQIILDTVNILNMHNHTRMDELVAQSIELFGDRIRVLHMKDYLPAEGAEDVLSMACGAGGMDYTRLLAFAKAHPGLPMTLEDTVPANAVAAREYLEKAAAQ
jgi:sugar phosphate isomerase/epimerase